MNLSRARSVLIIVLWLSAVVARSDDSGLELPAFIGHNMVLQRDAVNVLRGKAGPKEYVSVSYKHPRPFETRADEQGFWALELPTKGMPAGPESLEFSLGRKKTLRHALTLTNVVVGDVLLIGSIKQSVPPPPNMLAENQVRQMLGRIRLMNIASMGQASSNLYAMPMQWKTFAPGAPEIHHLSVQAFAWGINVTETYTGIIQTRAEDLSAWSQKNSLRSDIREKSRASRQSLLFGSRDAAHSIATNTIASAIEQRLTALAAAKHRGVVTNIPSPVQCDWPMVKLREQFDPASPPASLITFDSAIW